MKHADHYMPVRVLFGPGKFDELAGVSLPGKKALICMTGGGSVKRLGIFDRTIKCLEANGTEYVIFDKVKPNPTDEGVEEAARLGRDSGCDFVLGLGGGSSIDTAKAVAVMMASEGRLWDYAYTGSGLQKPIEKAVPIVAVTTTSGTGTETDPGCVVTKVETGEKLDFIADCMFPALSIIDPELMLSLPRSLTLYQGFDALFHCAECFITNQNENKIVDMYAEEGIRIISKWLPVVAEDGNNLEARMEMAFAADVCAGYNMSMIGTTSHHIVAQTMGGMFPDFIHGASLIVMAEEYYKRVTQYFPDIFDQLGEFMGIDRDPDDPGAGFVKGLTALMDKTGMRNLPMSEFGIPESAIHDIADYSVNRTGIADVDLYTLTVEDIEEILRKSYR